MTNTYEFPGKEDVQIAVGDEKKADFFPRMKIKRWDNEVNFSLGVISTFQGSHDKVGDKVAWDDGHGVKARFYPKPLRVEPTIVPDSFRYIDLAAITPDMMERVYEIERHGIEPTIITYTPDADCFVVHGHQPFTDYIDKKHTINEVRLLQFGGNSPIMFGDRDTTVIDIQFDSELYSAQKIFDIVSGALCKEFKLHGHGRYYNDKDEKVATLIQSKNHVVGYIRFQTIDRSKFLQYCNTAVNDAAEKYKVGSVTGDMDTFTKTLGLVLVPGAFTTGELKYPIIVGDYESECNILEGEHQRTMDQFEFELELLTAPLNNIINLSIETKGLDFLYQPHEVPEGSFRPENVKGSYAVYHKEMQGGKYRAGKAFHIYRPFVTDSEGRQEWCELDISEGVMRITMPVGLVYPVVIDPTFGCDPANHGGSWQDLSGGWLIGSHYMSPANIDTAQSISSYMKKIKDEYNMKGCIVLHSNLNIIANGTGAASPAATSETGEWLTSTFGTDPSPATSTKYVLMIISNAGAADSNLAYDEDVANRGCTDANSYDSPTDVVDPSYNINKYSIYCTYTETGGAAVAPTSVIYGPLIGPLGGPI